MLSRLILKSGIASRSTFLELSGDEMSNQDLLNSLLNMKGYRYKLWEYRVSHSILRIRAMPTKDNLHNPTHIEFRDVAYIQMPNDWETGDFQLGTDDEFYSLAGKMKLQRPYDDYLKINKYRLFKSQTSRGQVYIIGKLGKIE